MSGNGKPEVIDYYGTSYDGVAFVYIFLDTLYFFGSKTGRVLLTTEKN
jgi:hypothetical protein